jgi:hypothetical protein
MKTITLKIHKLTDSAKKRWQIPHSLPSHKQGQTARDFKLAGWLFVLVVLTPRKRGEI